VRVRNRYPFTERRKKFLGALGALLNEIDCGGCGDVSYEFISLSVKSFGLVPKLRFYPHGRSVALKAEVMVRAGQVSEARLRKAEEARKKAGIPVGRDSLSRVLARQFESEWNNAMLQLFRSASVLGKVNMLLCRHGERLSEPVRIVQASVLELVEKEGNREKTVT